LPESQLDRFMLRLRMGYPGPEDEKQILRDREHAEPLDDMRPVMSGQDVTEMSARSMRGESAWRRGVGGVVQAAHQSECLAQPTDVSFD
jgi:MoxR-like ATPase